MFGCELCVFQEDFDNEYCTLIILFGGNNLVWRKETLINGSSLLVLL